MTAKNKKCKTAEMKLKADNPRKVRAALKGWMAETEKLNPDPLGLDEAPTWVERAFAEVIKVIVPGRKLPMAGEWDLELIGGLLGRVQAFGKMFNGEIPVGPEMQAGKEWLEKVAVSQPWPPEIKAKANVLARDFEGRLEATQKGIPDFVNAALESSHEDALKIQSGLLRGMNLVPDELTPGQTFQRHTLTFLVLATQWRRFSKCRSVGQIYKILCKEIGENRIGSLKTFEERVAKKIGLKVRGRGRPSEK
jgi:hypothetical protein